MFKLREEMAKLKSCGNCASAHSPTGTRFTPAFRLRTTAHDTRPVRIDAQLMRNVNPDFYRVYADAQDAHFSHNHSAFVYRVEIDGINIFVINPARDPLDKFTAMQHRKFGFQGVGEIRRWS